MLVLTLHERSMADMMDRQLTHRNAARSITGMAAMLAHEVKNPLSGIRGAAQLLEQDADPAGRELTQLICDEADRIVALVDRMEAFSDTGRSNANRSISTRSSIACARRRNPVSRATSSRRRIRPSLPCAWRSRPAGSGLSKSGQERRRGTAERRRRNHSDRRLIGTGRASRVRGGRAGSTLPLMVAVTRQWRRHSRRPAAPSFRTVRHDQDGWHWPRSCTGRQGDRRPRRRDRIRQPAPANRVPGVSAGGRARRCG